MEIVKNLIKENKINEAIDELSSFFSIFIKHKFASIINDYYNQLILLSARYKELKQNEYLGTISYNEFQIEKSKITYSLLKFTDNIPTDIYNQHENLIKTDKEESQPPLEQIKWKTYDQINNYQLVDIIRTNKITEIWKAKYRDNSLYVLKRYNKSKDLLSNDLLLNEYRLASKLNHQNLIKVLDYETYKSVPFLAMPFYENGDLENRIKNYRIVESDIFQFIKQISSVLTYLHSNNIVHGDIKPRNILLDTNGNYILSDFALGNPAGYKHLSEILHSEIYETIKTIRMLFSPAYAPPEAYSQNYLKTTYFDIFSFGVSLLHLVNGELPEYRFGIGSEMIDKNLNIEIETNVPNIVKEIIIKCLSKKERDRYTANELYEIAKNINH